MTLQRTRHRLATLRNELAEQLRKLKSGSTIYKTTKGRMGGVMDAIEICDQELLAEEQGKPYIQMQNGTRLEGFHFDEPVRDLTAGQLAWMAKRNGDV